MVLANLAIDLSEEEISRIIGASDFGTPSFAIQKLATLNLQVDYREWTVPALLSALTEHKPVIIFVRTGFMDYWESDFAHAIIVVGAILDERFWVYDPAQADSPLSVSWDGLLAAWAEFGYRGATITPARK